MEGFNEKYLGREIQLSADQCYMLSTISRYRQHAEYAAQQYIQKYQSYKSFQVFSSQGIQDGYAILKWYFSKMLDDLIQMGYYDINKTNALSRYGEDVFAPWAKMEEFAREILEESNQRVTQNEEYRALRKTSRGRVVGGGFGLKGAIGGMAMAGTFNALSGLAHSGANAIGNAKTRRGERDRLNRIYQSPMMIDGIRSLFTDTFLQMAWLFLSYQRKYDDISLPGTDEDLTRAEALRENFQKIPADKQPDVAVQILTLAPLTTATYQFLLKQYQDPQGVLGRFANAVGLERTYRTLVDRDLAPKVDEVINRLSSRMKHVTMAEITSSSVSHILEENHQDLQNICAAYGLNANAASDLLAGYNKRLEQAYCKELEKIRALEQAFVKAIKDVQAADQRRRTFRGSTYETLALAEQARQVWENAFALAADCDQKTSAELDEQLASLHALMNQAPESLKPDLQILSEKIAERRKKKDQEERTYLDTLFPSLEARAAAEEQYNTLITQWLSKDKLTSEHIQAAKKSVEFQKDLAEPVRQAILKQIAAQEQKLAQKAADQQIEKACRRIESFLIIINLLYCAIVFWALFCWKLFRINGAEISAIDFFQLAYHNTNVITAARGFLAVGVIVCAIQTLSVMKNALKEDLDQLLTHPSTILMLGLLSWGLTAFFDLTYDIAPAYVFLLMISLILQLINHAKNKKLDRLYSRKSN